jgi:phosphoribosyl 1,2-cyclic phosphodiesterase
MRVKLWGTRGSLPSPGPDTVRYGGNTACVEVRGADGAFLILDAGTGIQRLGAGLDSEASRVDLLLTHLHLDHIQGVGFFRALFRPDLEVHIWGPTSTTLDLRARLARYLSPPLFPVRIRDLPCRLMLHDLPRGQFTIGGLMVTADFVCHPGPTVGYRIAEGARCVAYLPDHEPALGARHFPGDPHWLSGFDLASQVDLLIHDSQFSAAEYADHVGWGHSSIPHALAFAAAAGVRQLVAFHHDPSHGDSTLDQLFEEARRTLPLPFELTVAAEGASFDLAE